MKTLMKVAGTDLAFSGYHSDPGPEPEDARKWLEWSEKRESKHQIPRKHKHSEKLNARIIMNDPKAYDHAHRLHQKGKVDKKDAHEFLGHYDRATKSFLDHHKKKHPELTKERRAIKQDARNFKRHIKSTANHPKFRHGELTFY